MFLSGGDNSNGIQSLFRSSYPFQLTELYEYGKKLGNSQFMMASFQTYKVIYALHLADFGLTNKALNYIEDIQSVIILKKKKI